FYRVGATWCLGDDGPDSQGGLEPEEYIPTYESVTRVVKSDGTDNCSEVVVADFVRYDSPREDQVIGFGGRGGRDASRPVAVIAPQFADGARPGKRGGGQATLERLQARAEACRATACRGPSRGRCSTRVSPKPQQRGHDLLLLL